MKLALMLRAWERGPRRRERKWTQNWADQLAEHFLVGLVGAVVGAVGVGQTETERHSDWHCRASEERPSTNGFGAIGSYGCNLVCGRERKVCIKRADNCVGPTVAAEAGLHLLLENRRAGAQFGGRVAPSLRNRKCKSSSKSLPRVSGTCERLFLLLSAI